MSEVKFRCSKCKREAYYAGGIGHYCPNEECANLDFGIETYKEATH